MASLIPQAWSRQSERPHVSRLSLLVLPLLALPLLALSGCGSQANSVPATITPTVVTLQGSVHGGQQPVAGALVQLYAAGATGDQSAATPLLASPVSTAADGSFAMGAYTCPSSTAQVYVAAQGGSPGPNAPKNSAIVLLAALGPCNSLGSIPLVAINEVSTVASIYPLRPFMASWQNLGASSADAASLTSGFSQVNELLTISTDQSPGPALPANFTAPVDKLYTLANVLDACVNSAGGTAGDGSACGSLFQQATPPGGHAPTNAADAILDIANNPTQNVTAIYSIPSLASPPFQPVLTAAPPDWTLPILPDLALSTPSTLVGIGSSGTGSITLAQAAPAGGLPVSLASSNPNAVAVLSPVRVAAGQTSAAFTYSGLAAGTSAITASAPAYAPVSETLTATSTVIALGALPTLAPGQTVALPVTLASAAPQGGVTVTLSSSSAAVSISPQTLGIPAGATSPTTPPQVTASSVGSSQITAIAPNYAPGSTAVTVAITLTASLPASVSLSVGTPATETLTLSGPAPAGGVAFTLSSGNPAILTVPASITIPQGASSAAISITPIAPGSTTVQATSKGIAQVSSAALVTLPMPQRASLLGEYLLTEGSGTTAHDSSGNANDGTISGAVWESTPGLNDLNFNVVGDYIQVPAALNPTRTWQFALYNPPFGNATLPLAPGYGAANDFPINPSILCGTDNAHLCLDAGTPGKSPEFSAFNTDGTQSAVPLTPGWHIVSLLCGSNVNGVLSKSHLLYDGQEVSSYVFQGDANTCPTPTSGNYQIGGSSLYTGTFFFGKLAAAWAWSTPLTVAEASAAAATALTYIQSKGITTSFANANNPTPLLIAGIDSRTAGFGLPNSSDVWVNQMALNNTSIHRVDVAANGTLAYDACVQFETVFGEQYPPSGSVITVLWGAVNDIQFSPQSAAQIAANLQCMVTKAKAHGSLVILATEISSLGHGDQGKDALDPILRANAFAWGVDNLADLASNPTLGADGASSNTNCFPDGLHPNTTCEPFVTAIMQDAVNELTGSSQSAPNTTSASTYQELAADRFLNLTGAGQTVTLPSCIGYSLVRSIANQGASSASLLTLNNETLTGSASIPPGATALLTPIPGAVSTGGCSWSRTN